MTAEIFYKGEVIGRFNGELADKLYQKFKNNDYIYKRKKFIGYKVNKPFTIVSEQKEITIPVSQKNIINFYYE